MANRDQPKVLTKKHLARVERERRQNLWIVISASVVLLVVVALIGYGVLDQTVLQYNRPVLKVGEDVVTVREFQKQVSMARAQKIMEYNWYQQFAQIYGAEQFTQTLTSLQTALDSPTTIGNEVLQTMTDNLLIQQEAAKTGITVTAEEIDAKMREMFGFYPDGTPTPSLTPTAFSTPTYNPTQLMWSATRPAIATAMPEFTATVDQAPTATLEPTATFTPTVESTPTLEPSPTATAIPATPTSSEPTATATTQPTMTPYTQEGYLTALASYLDRFKSFGFTEQDYRKTVEANLLREKFGKYLAGDAAHVSEEVWARHILVGTLEEAKSVKARLEAGEDFYTLAVELSIDTGTKDKGGDLGWFGTSQMVPEFEAAAFALSVGQISEPVATTFGFHVIQLLGKRSLPMTDYEWSSHLDTLVTDFVAKQKSERTDIETFDIWQEVVPSEPTILDFGNTPE